MKTLPLAEKVERLDRGLAQARIPHAFGGALALAYYATPRATVDIDVNVFLPASDLARLAKVLRRLGVDEIPGDVARDEQMRAWWGRTPVDVFFSYDDVHDAMRAAVRRVPFGSTTIPILAPEHLIVAKAAFNRAKDWIDIEQMVVAQDVLDRAEVERWLDHLLGRDDPRATRFRSLASELRAGE